MKITACVLVAGIPFAALAAAPSAEMREGAALIARMGAAAEKRDLKRYCSALQDNPSYRAHLVAACEGGVQGGVLQPGACSPENIQAALKKDRDRCLALTPDEFEKNITRWREIRARFVQDLKAQNVDGEKLLKEEAAKLR